MKTKPRIINDDDLLYGRAQPNDLVLVDGGCPRYIGDECDLLGGYKSVVIAHDGQLYYNIIK
jgi:hypothetical protein